MRRILASLTLTIFAVSFGATASAEVSCQWEATADESGAGIMSMAFQGSPNCELVADQILASLELSNGASVVSVSPTLSTEEACNLEVSFIDAPASSSIQGCMPDELADALSPGGEEKTQRRAFWLLPLGGLAALIGGDENAVGQDVPGVTASPGL